MLPTFLLIFSFLLFSIDYIAHDVIAQKQDPSSSITSSESLIKVLLNDAMQALENGNSNKTMENLKVLLQLLRESKDNSSSVQVINLFLNDAIKSLNQNSTEKVLLYLNLTNQQFGKIYDNNNKNLTASITTNNINNNKFLTYNNAMFGIKINYPDNWSLRTYQYNLQVNNTVVGFYSPSKTASELGNVSGVSGNFVPYLDIFVFSSKNMSLDKIIDSRIDRIQNSTYFLISESKPFTIKGNQSAYILTYSINSGKDELFKKMQVYTIYGNKVYLITFTSQEAFFDQYRDTIQKMVNSFELLKTTGLQ